MTDELPANRTCEEAGIADVFCSCELLQMKDFKGEVKLQQGHLHTVRFFSNETKYDNINH